MSTDQTIVTYSYTEKEILKQNVQFSVVHILGSFGVSWAADYGDLDHAPTSNVCTPSPFGIGTFVRAVQHARSVNSACK